MQVNLNFCVFLVCLISYAFADVNFLDCGSDRMNIDTVAIKGCSGDRCNLQRRHLYQVIVTPDILVSYIDNADLDAKAIVRGALFEVTANFIQPCGLPCPIKDNIPYPNIPIALQVPATLIPGPASLIINATYLNRNVRSSHFCIELDIHVS